MENPHDFIQSNKEDLEGLYEAMASRPSGNVLLEHAAICEACNPYIMDAMEYGYGQLSEQRKQDVEAHFLHGRERIKELQSALIQ